MRGGPALLRPWNGAGMIPAMDPSPADPLHDALRALPSVDSLLGHPAVAPLVDDYPRGEVLHVVRTVIEERRSELRAGRSASIDIPALSLEIRQRLYERSHPNLRKVVNATGIVLHTGLGRAPLPSEAVAAMAEAAAGYCNLEIDLDSGRRGDRHVHVRDLLRELTGAEDAFVVNNNAAATYLALHALAAGREAIISRGQLVEIGGSYRLPEIMAAAGCRMVEVGTTNRTRTADYERAINAQTAILLRVHTSNYRIVGFTEEAALSELVALARRHNLIVVDDLGSGLLHRDVRVEADLSGEPTVRESLAGGADVALFSGDKLLGGPQAGIVVGRTDLVDTIRRDPLARAVRPCKLTLAALEATLRLYRDPEAVARSVPVLRLLSRPADELRLAADALAEAISRAVPTATVRTAADHSEAGGGSLATVPFPTWVVEVRSAGVAAGVVAAALRRWEQPILCRVRDEALVFDLRTLELQDAEQIPGALAEVLRELAADA